MTPPNDTAPIDSEHIQLVNALAPLHSRPQDNRLVIARTVEAHLAQRWPESPEEIGRLVRAICRAIVQRLSLTGANDWSIVDFGPGHGVAGISIEITRSDGSIPAPTDENAQHAIAIPAPERPEIAMIVWELDVTSDDESTADHERWTQRVAARLQSIARPLLHTAPGSHATRQFSGKQPIQYTRLELVLRYPLPQNERDVIDLASACAQIAESSVMIYTLVEHRNIDAI